ncbi:MAG: hypothetical protein GQ569_08610 [Methylococcaceae bacterium]|nr:hypothetical protein [Methylococcaceae bacterium]
MTNDSNITLKTKPISTEEFCRAVDYNKDWKSFAEIAQGDTSFLKEREDVIEEGRVNSS